MMRSVLVLALLGGLYSQAAEAKLVQTTRYTYYPISGKTATQIYDSMIRSGPHVNGSKAYAATSATTTQEAMIMEGKSCSIKNYKLKIDFLVKLPKLRNDGALPPLDRKRWRQFETFVKAHEERHRQIWLGCAQTLEGKLSTLSAPTCAAVERRAEKLWNDMRTSCTRKHDAFDAAEQKKLSKHPFVNLVFRKKANAARGAKIQ